MLRALVVVLLVAATARARADGAEYAVRWDPAAGGPVNVEAITKALGSQASAADVRTVRYFKVVAYPSARPGWEPILRERSSDKGTEVTWKMRADGPVGAALRVCPLVGRSEEKPEIDITIPDAEGGRRISHSWSCSVEGTIETALPAAIQAQQQGCASTMTRWKAPDGIKIEHWSLDNGTAFAEVSWVGRFAQKDRAWFTDHVVRPLLDAGIKPLTGSKTELATRC